MLLLAYPLSPPTCDTQLAAYWRSYSRRSVVAPVTSLLQRKGRLLAEAQSMAFAAALEGRGLPSPPPRSPDRLARSPTRGRGGRARSTRRPQARRRRNRRTG